MPINGREREREREPSLQLLTPIRIKKKTIRYGLREGGRNFMRPIREQ